MFDNLTTVREQELLEEIKRLKEGQITPDVIVNVSELVRERDAARAVAKRLFKADLKRHMTLEQDALVAEHPWLKGDNHDH